MAKLIQKVSKKAGLSPGTPVFVGKKHAEEIKITAIDYNADIFELKEIDRIEECFPFKEKPTVTWINVDGLHEIAVIFIPLTFITGIYGMNFNPERSPFNMPELNWYFVYPFALGLMVTAGVGMLYYFKRKKWF